MKFVYVGIVVGLVLLSLAVLFFLPAKTTGFATNIEPTQRTLLGSFLGTAGVASFGVAALKKGKKRMGRQEEFSEAYFHHFDDLLKSVLYDTKLKPGEKIDIGDTERIVYKIAEKYEASEDMTERVAEYLSRKVREHPAYERAEKAVEFAIKGFASEVYYRPEEKRRKAVSKKWQI